MRAIKQWLGYSGEQFSTTDIPPYHPRTLPLYTSERCITKNAEGPKYRGEITPAMAKVLDHRADRARHDAMEQHDTWRYWERRKLELGIHRDMPLAHQLEHIREAREQAIMQAPARHSAQELAQQAQELQRSIAGLERHTQRLQAAHGVEQDFAWQGRERPYRAQLRVERLLAEGREHGLSRDPGAERAVAQLQHLLGSLEHDEAPQYGGMRARIFERARKHEEEREQGMGMGF